MTIYVIGGGKTGYNLYTSFIHNQIDSSFFYFDNEYGKGKKGGYPILDLDVSSFLKNPFFITSETAFVYFKNLLENVLPTHYYLREKQNLVEIANTLNVNTITEYKRGQEVFPVILKPKESGKTNIPFKTKVIANKSELQKQDKYLHFCRVQEFMPPEKYEQLDIGGYISRRNCSLISFVEKNQYPIGVASYIKYFSNIEIENIKLRLSDYLQEIGFNGFFEFEFLRNKVTNEFYLMDINPRVWGSFYYYISAIKNLKNVILNDEIIQLDLKKGWINPPRLAMSFLKGNFISPPLKDIVNRKICYEPYF